MNSRVSDSVDAFLRRVIADPVLSARLQASRTREEFITLASELARSAGFAIGPDKIRSAGWTFARDDGGTSLDEVPGPDWLPTRVDWTQGEPRIHWCFLGRRRLSEPFFSETIDRARWEPFSWFVRATTSFDALERHAEAQPGLPLIGLIAHVSRCGSTLVSQMLASVPGVVVASEPPPFDAVLREGPQETARAVRVRWLRAMASALGQRRGGTGEGFVIKLDSWHLASLPLVREAFPDVPCILLYRDPAAVLTSHMREPGLQMVAGVVGSPFDEIPFAGLTQLEYRARVVGRLFEEGARVQEGTLLVSYPELPDAVRTRIAPHFGLRLDAETCERLLSVGKREAKNPAQEFIPRATVAGGKASTPGLEAMADHWAGAAYRLLESRRVGSS